MDHTTESANKNDIVTQLGVQGVGFGGPGAFGAPYFNVQGYSPMGDSYAATPMHAWDTIIEGRDTLSWQVGRHSIKTGIDFRRLQHNNFFVSTPPSGISRPTPSSHTSRTAPMPAFGP